MAVGTDGRDADAERHDERDSHRAGGDASRVERDREEIAGGKKRQAKHNQVKYREQVAQRDAEQHTQQRDDQKRTHAACNRKDQRHIGDRGYLFGEHLQIRFGNGDDKAKQEGQDHDQPELFAAGHTAAHELAHRAHGDIGAQGEEHHPDDEQYGAEQKAQQDAGRNWRDAEAEYKHNPDDRQHGV